MREGTSGMRFQALSEKNLNFVPALKFQSSLRGNKFFKMKQFLFVYRADYKAMPKTSPEEAQALTQTWINWIAGIAAQNKLADKGNRLTSSGSVLKGNNVISDGPYAEIKESILGYSVVNASTFEEARQLAAGCPILAAGGNVEIREIDPM